MRKYEGPIHVLVSFFTGRTVNHRDGKEAGGAISGMVDLCSFLAGSDVPDTVLRSPDLFRPTFRKLLPAGLAAINENTTSTADEAYALRDSLVEKWGETIGITTSGELLPPN